MQNMIGTVHWFASSGQSYGFINYQYESDWRQVYFHYKSIGTNNLRPENKRANKWFREAKKGDVVKFDITEGFGMPNGTQAVNVEILLHADNY
jgi:cold shock CspA family protein